MVTTGRSKKANSGVGNFLSHTTQERCDPVGKEDLIPSEIH